ncbi:uncharacterized protein [Argopecten irradians]|uniref:uncharacterized protein n=1 Tax=Argopecten irradians TaxID=31199 RepID=UPI00371DAD08
MSIVQDSVTDLVKQLCVFYTNDRKRAFLKQPPLSKAAIQKQLKKKAYETIFAYLVGPIRWQRQISNQTNPVEDERVHILSYALDLRCRRRYDDANRLEELLENLVPFGNPDVSDDKKDRLMANRCRSVSYRYRSRSYRCQSGIAAGADNLAAGAGSLPELMISLPAGSLLERALNRLRSGTAAGAISLARIRSEFRASSLDCRSSLAARFSAESPFR